MTTTLATYETVRKAFPHYTTQRILQIWADALDRERQIQAARLAAKGKVN